MQFMKLLLAGVAALSLSAAAMANPLELAGVKVEDSAMVGGTKLQLNGAGIRVKFFKIYVGQLYTTKHVSNLEELVAAPGPKRLQMTFLREIDAASFGKLLTRGVEDNVPKTQMSKLVPGLMRMSEIFSVNKAYMPGDVITMDWIPGTGMVIVGKGKQQGEPFKEVEFFNAMMAIWFGPAPGDWKLKDAMLGIK
jgi:hypothetical protein